MRCLYCHTNLEPNETCTRSQCVDLRNASERRMGKVDGIAQVCDLAAILWYRSTTDRARLRNVAILWGVSSDDLTNPERVATLGDLLELREDLQEAVNAQGQPYETPNVKVS